MFPQFHVEIRSYETFVVLNLVFLPPFLCSPLHHRQALFSPSEATSPTQPEGPRGSGEGWGGLPPLHLLQRQRSRPHVEGGTWAESDLWVLTEDLNIGQEESGGLRGIKLCPNKISLFCRADLELHTAAKYIYTISRCCFLQFSQYILIIKLTE